MIQVGADRKDGAAEKAILGAFVLGGATVLALLWPGARRRTESAVMRARYGRGLRVTQELPVESMSEIVFGRRR